MATVQHSATIDLDHDTTWSSLVSQVQSAGVHPDAKVEIHEEPRLQSPVDPGGRRYIRFSWTTFWSATE